MAPAAPSTQERLEGQTIMDVLDGLAALGYTAHLAAKEGAMVQCYACSQLSPARDVAMERLGRMEGPSDPGSEVVIAGVVCPQCRAKGTLTLSYGPMGGAIDGQVLAALRDERPTARPGASHLVPRA